MKKKIFLIITLILILIITTSSLIYYFINKTPTNTLIEYNSSSKYENELKTAIKNNDLTYVSDLVYSIYNSEFKEELIEKSYNKAFLMKESYKNKEELIYDSLISLISNIEIKEYFKLDKIDNNFLKLNVSLFSYEIDNTLAIYNYYVTERRNYSDLIHTQLQISYDECKDVQEENNEDIELCKQGIFAGIEQKLDSHYYGVGAHGSIIYYENITNYDKETIKQNYKYEATQEFNEVIDNTYALDYAVNRDNAGSVSTYKYKDKTPKEVEQQLINTAHSNGQEDYGDYNNDGKVDLTDDINNVNINPSIWATANSAGNDELIEFGNTNYEDKETGMYDVEKIISDEYNSVFSHVSTDIYGVLVEVVPE